MEFPPDRRHGDESPRIQSDIGGSTEHAIWLTKFRVRPPYRNRRARIVRVSGSQAGMYWYPVRCDSLRAKTDLRYRALVLCVASWRARSAGSGSGFVDVTHHCAHEPGVAIATLSGERPPLEPCESEFKAISNGAGGGFEDGDVHPGSISCESTRIFAFDRNRERRCSRTIVVVHRQSVLLRNTDKRSSRCACEHDVRRLVAQKQRAHHRHRIEIHDADTVGDMIHHPRLSVRSRSDRHRIKPHRDGPQRLDPGCGNVQDLESVVGGV